MPVHGSHKFFTMERPIVGVGDVGIRAHQHRVVGEPFTTLIRHVQEHRHGVVRAVVGSLLVFGLVFAEDRSVFVDAQ
jgi:hypothetical protein